jgi:hypothetical protein
MLKQPSAKNTAQIINFPSLPPGDLCLCPECGKPTSTFLQVDRILFAICELDKAHWVAKLDLSSDWLQHLTPKDWTLWHLNSEKLNSYRLVMPAFHP